METQPACVFAARAASSAGLRLSEPQIAELEKLVADIAGDASSSHLATVLSIPEKLKARWIELLTAEQRDRLHEIELQRAPLLKVLCEPEVVKHLALRSDQIKDIEVVHSKDYYRKQARIAKDLDPVSLDDVARTEERLNALLSEEQKSVLKRIRGRPVESKAY